jgi:hypothetical protein
VPSTVSRLVARATARRNLTIYAAILAGVLAAGVVERGIPGADWPAPFLLLVTLAVGVPTAHDEYGPTHDRTSQAVAWVLAGCVVAAVEFVAVYLAAGVVAGLSVTPAAVVAFLATAGVNLWWLVRRDG